MRTSRLLAVTSLALAAGLASGLLAQAPSTPLAPPDAALVLQHTRVLSSGEFEGRLPGTPGEEKTVRYIAEQFAKYGLTPAAPDGTFMQPVPLVGVTGTPSPLTVRAGDTTRTLAVRDEVVAWTRRQVPEVRLDGSEMVFVGYGVEAAQFAWDDYKGVDLAGKTMVVLIGDPPVPDPKDPSQLDPATFGGRAMTYYGRWTYKFDMGAARRAAGVLIVHETGPAGYGFSIVQGRLAEQFDLRADDRNQGRPAVEGWVTLDAARAMFAMAGHDLDALKARAARRDFAPVPLGLRADLRIENRLRPVDSRNVVGKLEGSDPARRDECVVFTAHWDHFGHGSPVNGETIRHGALDNATGVAGLLEMARLFGSAPRRPPRTLLFVSVTAEEQGLLGSEYYVRRPVVPLAKTLAVLNFEMLNVYGRTSDLTVYGLGASDLDDYLRAAAARQGRELRPDPAPEQGWFYRSDHFPFARAGVPATWAGGGDRFIGKDAEYGKRMRDEYVANRYHKPADVVRPEWDLAGGVEDLQVYADVAWAVAHATAFPAWKPGAEFAAAREKSLAAAPRQ